MRLFIINTNDDKKKWWQFRRSTTFNKRLVDDAQKNEWTYKKRFLFSSKVSFCNLSIISRMCRRQNDVKSSMNLIIIIINRYTTYFKYTSTRKDWITKHLTNELFDEIFFKQEMSKSIIFDKNSLFTFNFWSNFCYHLRIKI
jgi:hypothetical protein